MKIYIVQEITYDYYEFIVILYAATSITKINQYLYSEEFIKEYKDYPILFEGDDYKDIYIKRESHIYIEEFQE